MIRPISWGIPSGPSRCVARSMVAQTIAAAAMPTGLLRPSSAIPSPVKPMVTGKASPYFRKLGSDSRNGRPIMPATAPDMNRVMRTIRLGLTPADNAASGFMPDRRRS